MSTIFTRPFVKSKEQYRKYFVGFQAPAPDINHITLLSLSQQVSTSKIYRTIIADAKRKSPKTTVQLLDAIVQVGQDKWAEWCTMMKPNNANYAAFVKAATKELHSIKTLEPGQIKYIINHISQY